MNAEQEEAARQVRVRQAEIIKSEAAEYKVCLVCSSLSHHPAAVCPVCKAYQWSFDPAVVAAKADEAARSVFPMTLGYAPTFARDYRFPAYVPPPPPPS